MKYTTYLEDLDFSPREVDRRWSIVDSRPRFIRTLPTQVQEEPSKCQLETEKEIPFRAKKPYE
jgi:hypothetical protein